MDKNIWTILALFCLALAALQGTWWTAGATTPAPFYMRINVGWLGLAILLGWMMFK